MPRAPRLILAGQAHHIIQRGNNRQVIFFEDADRRFFLSALGEALAAHDCQLHACVLMTRHLHLLLTPRTETAEEVGCPVDQGTAESEEGDHML